MILDIPPHVEQVLVKTADTQGVSVSDLITQWAMAYQNPMIAKAQSLPRPTSYSKSAVALQRQWRDEWD